jgi:hypothetical protein
VKDFAEIIAGRSPQAAAAGARESPHASTPMADDFVSGPFILGHDSMLIEFGVFVGRP